MIRSEQVWLAVEPVDTRMGIDSLSLKIQQALGRSPCDGTAYAFRNLSENRIKLLVWDGTSVWLCVRRLHRLPLKPAATHRFFQAKGRDSASRQRADHQKPTNDEPVQCSVMRWQPSQFLIDQRRQCYHASEFKAYLPARIAIKTARPEMRPARS